MENQTNEQIAQRYIAKKAILSALIAGRKISLLDSLEFKVSEMHTQICSIRQDIERKNLPFVMNSKWIEKNGKRLKEYWLEGAK